MRRRTRERHTRDGVRENEFEFFAHGPYFGGQDFAEQTSEAERETLWRQHRAAILSRYTAELRQKGPGWAGHRPDYFWRELEAAGHARRQVGVQEWWGPWEPGGQKKGITPILESDVAFLARVSPSDLESWELEVAGHADR